MLYLMELSVPLSMVRRSALITDPIIAADQGYAVKTWLSGHEGVAMRPWGVFPAGESVRLVGWRHQAPQASTLSTEIYASHRQFTCRDGDELSFVGQVVPRAGPPGTERLDGLATQPRAMRTRKLHTRHGSGNALSM